ncbi:RB-associated KRAB zinc finger protein-like [Mercenaria mercenaria]|uniref:RB-associated KRAB zinc finger protein-like n=1 Tax=Mercenaria mercenaria TaxID=6596 RepID=UPI00234FA5C9|nr:RB-associated KRAB zinc finger protein-like [Mercenaria mercenaria]
MENEGNSLLENEGNSLLENEGNSLLELPLESSEILEEVNLNTDHVGTVADNSVDNVGEMLIDENAQSGIPCIESNSIDFEFVNSDLGNSAEFNMDNSSVFGMTDNDIDAREDCEYLFRDSTCFSDSVNKQIDAGTLQHSGVVSVPSSGKMNLYKDLGLKLQVIPLNNLQYVSTIQTSKGLHILAIPAQTSVSSNCNEVVQQTVEKSKLSSADINQSLKNRSQNKLKEVPNLEVETRKVNEKTKKKNRDSVNGPSASKSTKKLRNSLDRSFIICRNNSFRKGCVRKGLLKQGKDEKESTNVLKTDNSRKHRMVSLLNTSVTNKLKQAQNTANRKGKEIKVTFHLKPPDIVRNTTKENFTEDIPSKAVSEDMSTLKTNESLCSNTKGGFETDKLENHHVTNEVINDISDREKIPVLEGNEHVKPPDNPDKMLKVDTAVVVNGAPGKKYQCKVCLSTFTRQGHFKNHMKTHKEITSEQKNSTENVTNFESKVEYHINQLENKIPDLKGNSNESEGNHVDKDINLASFVNSHNNSNIMTCEFCGMEFKTQGNLTRHKLTHSVTMGTKVRGRFECDVCNKSFMQKCDLKRHVFTHSGTYLYTCTVCQKGFIRRSDLTVHEKFHTQEKQYKCTLCSKAYFQTGDLSRHMRQNHSDLCEYACQDCGRKYTTQKTLNLHRNRKH